MDVAEAREGQVFENFAPKATSSYDEDLAGLDELFDLDITRKNKIKGRHKISNGMTSCAMVECFAGTVERSAALVGTVPLPAAETGGEYDCYGRGACRLRTSARCL